MVFIRFFLFFFNMLAALSYGVGEVSNTPGETRVLRVVTLHNFDTALPRSILLRHKEWRYLEQFARDHHFHVKAFYVYSQDEAFDLLKAQKADIYVSQLIYSPVLDPSLLYSSPLLTVDEYLVGGPEMQVSISNDLTGKTLGILQTPHQETIAKKLMGSIANLHVVNIPLGVNGDHLYRQLNAGLYDYVMIPSDQFISDQLYRNDLKKSHQLTENNGIVWALGNTNEKLLAKVNVYLLKKKNNRDTLDVVRVGLVNHHDSYFILHGEEKGFHFSLIDHFFREKGLSYRVVLAKNKYQLKSMLKEKKIDIAADFYSEDDVEACCMQLSAPLFYSFPVFVENHTEKQKKIDMASGRFLSVPTNSPYMGSLHDVLKYYPSLKLLKISEAIPTKTLLKRLRQGVYDLTFAENYAVDRESQYLNPPFLTAPAGDKMPAYWLVAHERADLIDGIERYLDEDHIARVYDQYFRFFTRKPSSPKTKRSLNSPYDALIVQLAATYQLDPRLLAAQMYQESQFDPSATSGKGGVGLFQMHKKPAHFFGFDEITSPMNNIHAAVSYMEWLKQQLIALEVQESAMPWFLLAAYHVGIDHVKDAIHLAHKQGLPTDRWFLGVAQAMMLLEDPKFYTYARFGYIRGSATVSYVSAIKAIYDADKQRRGEVRQLLVEITCLAMWKHRQNDDNIPPSQEFLPRGGDNA